MEKLQTVLDAIAAIMLVVVVVVVSMALGGWNIVVQL